MQVEVTDRRGAIKVMDERFARILVKLGRYTYLTRDMAPELAFPDTGDTRTVEKVDEYIKAENAQLRADEVDLDALDAEELHALAKERGVAVHHRAGAEKVREALRAGE